jgi:membrane protein DedA with SNARE-associated domain
MIELFQTVTDWYMSHINYFTITVLMAIESSFIPFPSEIVIPPAAWKAAQGEMNIFLVVFFGTFGALIGALFNYFVALYLGRKIVYKLADTKIAHLMLINKQGVEKAEKYFIENGNISTFIGRLVPAIRQLISLPAGLARMNLRPFMLYTFLGSCLWNIILAVLGYTLYSQKELLHRYYKEFSYGFLILGLLFGIYLVYKAFRNRK